MTILDSIFEENFSSSRGSIILGDYKETISTIKNSLFIGNYAYEGGVFFTQYSSTLIFDNCTFYNNFAVRGGIGSSMS